MCLDTPFGGVFPITQVPAAACPVILTLFEGIVHMKRFVAFLLALCTALSLLAVPAAAVGYDPSNSYVVQADSAYIVNTDTNIIIYEKNSELPVQANSLTQLMTVADKDANMDMTYEYELQTKLGCGVMLNGAFGCYDIDA